MNLDGLITNRTARLPTDYAKQPASKAARKYRNTPVVVDGIRFASKAEAARWGELKLLYAARKIENLRTQPRFKLPGGVVYVGDFYYREEDGREVVEDIKGFETRAFKNKAKQFRERYPDIDLRIVKVKR